MRRIWTVHMICLLALSLVLTLGACQQNGAITDGMEDMEEWTHEICEKHDDGEWIVEKEPTETETGKKVLACTTCGEVLMSVTLPVLEPETTATVTTDAVTTAVPCEHDGGEWVTVKEPTATENGKKQLECTKCGAVLISVPVLPETEGDAGAQ